MFPKENRAERSDIVDAKKLGVLKKADSFAVMVHQTKALWPPRVVIIVSTKVSGKAVERNKVKRMVRSIIVPRLNAIKAGTVLLFLTNKRTLVSTREQLVLDLERILKHI